MSEIKHCSQSQYISYAAAGLLTPEESAGLLVHIHMCDICGELREIIANRDDRSLNAFDGNIFTEWRDAKRKQIISTSSPPVLQHPSS
jgi:hypothetical protein